MAYIKNTWVDQEVERPRTYQKEDHADGSFTLIDDFGLVSELGTPVNADNMNHIEDGIEDHENRITVLEEAGDASNFLNKSQITNCITEIPQRIKYTLENGTLTIKAGTVLIVPYGTEDLTAQYPIGSTFIHENFKVVDTQYVVGETYPIVGVDNLFIVWVEVQNDIIENKTSTVAMARYGGVNITSNSMYYMNNLESGTATSSTNTYAIYYNTNTNLVGFADGTKTISYSSVYAYPVFVGTSSTTTLYDTIDYVFNGFGYIGNTLWADKGIKGLAPNSRNDDGTLKNEEIIQEWFCVVTETGTSNSDRTITICGRNHVYNGKMYPIVWDNNYNTVNSVSEVNTTQGVNYNRVDNKMYYYRSGKILPMPVAVAGRVKFTSGSITDISDLFQTYRAADWNELKDYASTPATTVSSASNARPAVVVQNYRSGTSWYRIWSDGWIEQGLTGVSNHNGTKVTLLKPFSNTNYTIALSRRVNGSYEDTSCTAYPTSTSQITIFGKDDGLRSIYACGY